jgi:thiol-disulfide isomerase/thioredoxin
MPDDLREIRNAVILWLLIAVVWAACANADATIVFGATWCGPCQAMKPIEDQLRTEGQIIQCVDIDKNPELARAYRVGRIPCFVRVIETPQGNYEVGRITGICTAGQLRRLAAAPCVVTVGAAARSVVRGILGAPAPIFPEW